MKKKKKDVFIVNPDAMVAEDSTSYDPKKVTKFAGDLLALNKKNKKKKKKKNPNKKPH